MPKKAIFIRGFDFGTTEAEVWEHCATVGKVVSVEIKGKGSALVTYGSEAQAQKAVAELQESTIPGNERYIDVKLKVADSAAAAKAYVPAPSVAPSLARRRLQPTAKSRIAPAPPFKPTRGQAPASSASTSVMVKGFDFETSEEDLQRHCATAGRIVSVELKSKGRAVVTYASGAQAQKAVAKLHGSVVPGNSRYIEVKMRGLEQTPMSSAPAALPSNRKVFVPTVGVSAPPAKKRKAGPMDACKVFVRGFDKGTTEEAVLEHCGTAGLIVESTFQKMSALLTYGSAEEADAAVAALAGSVIEGNVRYIDVKIDEGGAGGSQERPAKKHKKGGPTEQGPSGPDLPRERVTDEPICGKILHWKGKFGWIKPDERVEHPEAKSHSGKIYAHIQDVVTGEELEKGTEVQFYVFVDASGLGAEEVMPVN